jgi:hypothetical protein
MPSKIHVMGEQARGKTFRVQKNPKAVISNLDLRTDRDSFAYLKL